MECYITYCVKGYYAFDSDNQLICEKLFPDSDIIDRLIEIDEGKITLEEAEIINELSPDYTQIIIESNKRLSDYNNPKIKIENPNSAGEYLRSHYDEFGINTDEISAVYQNLAIYRIKKQSAGEDKHLIQAINSIDDIDEAISKLIERIREWYALYFPEMDTVKNNETYIKLISQNTSISEIVKAKPDAFPDDLIDFEEDINPDDLAIMNDYANSIYELQKTRKNITEYIDAKMKSIAPNLSLLVGSSLGAKLISHAGGIKRLSMYPSSTVQIMGAEKALFRHLKSGDRPPKHGLIYQHPEVRGAKWWNRGKVARLLAGRISLAVRRDVFSDTVDESISVKFIEDVSEIEKNNHFPKKTTRKRKEEKSKRKKSKKKRKKR